MKLRYFPTLLGCITVSLLILGVGSTIAGTHWLWIPAAVLPLAFYHLFFLRPRIKQVPDSSAIDSVYYFGFLVTVAALALSAVSLARSAVPDFNSVLIKFGIGMIATGYAVIARMHLQSLLGAESTDAAEAIMDTYVRRTQSLIDNVETAIVRVNGFSQVVIDETRESQIRLQAQVDDSLLQSVRHFQKELETIAGIAERSLASLLDLVKDVQSAPERLELAQIIRETSTAATDINRNMEVFSTRFEAAAEAVITTKGAMDGLRISIENFSQIVTGVGAPDGHLTRGANALVALTENAAKATEAAGNALRSTADLAAQIDTQSTTFKGLSDSANALAGQLQEVHRGTGSLTPALEGFAAAADQSKHLAGNMDNVRQMLPGLSTALETATFRVAELERILSSAAHDLKANIVNSAEVTVMLTASLNDVAKTIIDQTRRHQGVA